MIRPWAISLFNAACGLLAALALIAASPAKAVVTCAINALPGMAFGSYSPFSAAPLDSAATATIICDATKNNDVASLTVTASAGNAGVYATRTMLGPGGGKLNYNLYLDAGRTQVFGDNTGGSASFTYAATMSKNVPLTVTQTIYGRIFAGQDVAVGTYSDVLIYTVNF